jgi:nicotinate-nucleotide adenylyltransferase
MAFGERDYQRIHRTLTGVAVNLGVFGGTFDPPHYGHLIVAWHVLQEVGLDRIIFVPGATPPHKQDRQVSLGEHRLAMLRLASAGNPRFEVSDVEIRRGGVSFTVDTLLELKKERPGENLYFLLGMDNLVEFSGWKDPDKILQMATLVVMTRPGWAQELSNGTVLGPHIVCDVPAIGISSSMIRDRCMTGKRPKYLVVDAVEKYIVEHGLYR